MQYKINLLAGVPQRQEFSGTTLVLMDTGAAASIDMSVELQGYAVEEMRGVKRGLKMQTPGFTAAKFTAAVNCTIEVIASAANISVNYQEGATVNANIIGTVPVSNDLGSLATPLHVVGVTYTDAPAVTLQDNAAVTVTDTGAALVAANANRRGLRFTNIGTDQVTIGFTGITWAKRCIVLNNGDTWIEERAANLAWAADCDTAKTASVTVQEVIA
jgi:hypothetical protein